MFIKFSGSDKINKLLLAIFIASAVIRFSGLFAWVPFFGDQAWYFLSARDAILTGNMPLLGITASITWLHQGPLWTYLLIPALIFSRFHPLYINLFMVLFNLACIPLAFYLGRIIKDRQTGVIYAALLGGFYFSVFHSRLAYHTSPIPLFFLLCLILILRGKSFLSGLFLGFLYQSHLLTLIYWPGFLLLIKKSSRPVNPYLFALGFILGIIPLVLSGPVATAGIFVWLASRVFLGFGGVGLISQAYLVVLLAPALLVLSLLLPKMKFPALVLPIGAFFVINYAYLITTGYLLRSSGYGLTYSQKNLISDRIISQSYSPTPEIIISGPGKEFASTRMPYDFLIWRKIRQGAELSGQASVFIVDEVTGEVRVLE